MANLYVRSTDGSDSDSGSTWALAKATLAGAAAIDAAGDTIYVSQAHAESTASAVSLALAGTRADPTRIICANDSAEPPTASATGASVTTTGASAITVTGTVHVYGIDFNVGTGASAANLTFAGSAGVSGYQLVESCNLSLLTSSASSLIRPCGDTATGTAWKNVGVKFSASGQKIEPLNISAFVWSGGSLLSGGTSPATLVGRTRSSSARLIEGVDLSNGGSTMNIFTAGTDPGGGGRIRNCRLPGSWTGSLATGTLSAGERYEMHNCDSGDTNYRLWVEDYAGSVKTETTIVRSGGASDGTTAYSWKLASSANTESPLIPLVTPEIAVWNDTTGSSITVAVEIVTDGVTLTDDECWLEVQYLGTSGYPLSSFASDAKADVLATAANQTSSSETWTTTGLASPTKQKLSVTITPQEKGYLQAVVKLAKASTTVYVDPMLTVT